MGHLFIKWVGDFAGNTAAFVAATLFGASVVATRVVVQGIPLLSVAVLRFGQGIFVPLPIMPVSWVQS